MVVPDVVGLGIANVDIVLRFEKMPRWEDPGRVEGFTIADGGPAGTACAVAALFGVKTGFIDTFGNDDMAERKMRMLEQVGVDVTRMIKYDEPEDHIAFVYVQAQTGERYFSFLKEFTPFLLLLCEFSYRRPIRILQPCALQIHLCLL